MFRTKRIFSFQFQDNGSLTISQIGKFDGGTYVCVASNPLGSIKKVFTLQTYGNRHLCFISPVKKYLHVYYPF